MQCSTLYFEYCIKNLCCNVTFLQLNPLQRIRGMDRRGNISSGKMCVTEYYIDLFKTYVRKKICNVSICVYLNNICKNKYINLLKGHLNLNAIFNSFYSILNEDFMLRCSFR